jgi:glycerol-3-phosphate dehydrogenase
MTSAAPIVVLGGGINGAAVARELALNQQDVILVDRADIASGATAYASRLIHGGLRYLEYREVDLVRESLAERERLLRIAPDFVKPLELVIPTETRFGGWRLAAANYMGWKWIAPRKITKRGSWIVSTGLRMYDRLSQPCSLPGFRNATRETTPFGRQKGAAAYRAYCSYWDAQIVAPERFTIALLRDAAEAAKQNGTRFEVLTYHEVRRDGVDLFVRSQAMGEQAWIRIRPAAVINCAGAWVDEALRCIHVDSPRCMGGTKGSHLVTFHSGLRAALGEQAVYAEAPDGLPLFLLPFLGGALVGTTDLRFEGSPGDAVTDDDEVAYLLEAIRSIFPELGVAETDIEAVYCGVRPLPYSPKGGAASITRRHWTMQHKDAPIPLWSVIWGKLTTCRSLAEETAHLVMTAIGKTFSAQTRERAIVETPEKSDVRSILNDEWVTHLSDLVERRLLSQFDPAFDLARLERYADAMVEAGKFGRATRDAEIESAVRRMKGFYRKRGFVAGST